MSKRKPTEGDMVEFTVQSEGKPVKKHGIVQDLLQEQFTIRVEPNSVYFVFYSDDWTVVEWDAD